MAINKLLFIPQWHISATISNPESNYKSLYPKSNDPHWYFVDSDGSEKRIETGLDFRNGITTTTLATSSVLRARLDIALGLGLTFAGNYSGSTISVTGVLPNMLSSINTGTAGYILTSNGNNFSWISPQSSVQEVIAGLGLTGGGTGSYITLDVNPSNGLSIIGNSIGLGGTLSQNTSIDGADFNLSFGTGASRLNSFGVESDDSIILRDDDGLNIISLDMSAAGGGSILSASEQISGSGVVFSLGAYGKGYFQATTGTDFFKIELDAESVTKRMLVTDTITSRGLEYGGSYSGNFTTHSLVDKYYVDTQIVGVGSTITAENGLSFVGNTVSLGGTLSQATIIDVSTQSLALISVIDLNIPHYYGLVVENNVSQLGYTNQGSTTSRFESIIDQVSMITSDGSNQFSLSLDQSANQAIFYDSFNSKGLEYGGSYSGNFTTYSLVDKFYVDTQIAGISGGVGIIGLTAGLGLTGGGTGAYVTIDVNPSNGLSIIGNSVGLGGTLSQLTIIDTATFAFGILSLINSISNYSGIGIDYTNVAVGYYDAAGTESRFITDVGAVSMINTDGISTMQLTMNQITPAFFTDTFYNKGLEYSGSYSGNFTTYSLVDKFYVDTELSSFLPLSGGTLSGNLEINGTILMGDYVAPSLNSTVKVTTVTGSNTIYSIDKSLYTGAFFEYTVTKDTNARAGSIMSVWNGLTASYTETSTTDIGLTTDITFLVSATGSNAILTASASSNNWIIKTIVRSI